jgi:hypothetical protein
MGEGRHKVLVVQHSGKLAVSYLRAWEIRGRNDRMLYRLRLYFVMLGLKGWHEAAANGRKKRFGI